MAYVVPCHIPAQHTASPPALELPRTGMSGPLWAYALAVSVAGAALVALARRKRVTPNTERYVAYGGQQPANPPPPPPLATFTRPSPTTDEGQVTP